MHGKPGRVAAGSCGGLRLLHERIKAHLEYPVMRREGDLARNEYTYCNIFNGTSPKHDATNLVNLMDFTILDIYSSHF